MPPALQGKPYASCQPALKLTSGFVCCTWDTTSPCTSKASTTTAFDVACGCARPVTSMVSVCGPLLRPLTVNAGEWISSFGTLYRSTSTPGAPSTLSIAIPMSLPRAPNHVTDVPLKASKARAPAAVDCRAEPPLQPSSALVGAQSPVKVPAGSDSSTCMPAAARPPDVPLP